MRTLHPKTLPFIGAALLLTCTTLRAQTAPPDTNLEAALRARVSGTDWSRLHSVFDKAARGEPITVAVIGGSITAGAAATSSENRYADRVAQWWRDTFPRSAVTFVNAGIGATGSAYAALRAQRDLLSRRPDFVIVEFGVNDENTRERAETYEGLLRQILRQPQQSAVLLLFMKHRGGANAQEWQSRLGRYYALPMVSFRDAVQPQIDAKTWSEDDVMADDVHPNNRGHQLTAEFITSYLDAARKNRGKTEVQNTLPPPMLSDFFERVRFYDGGNLQPTKNVGWTFDKPSGSWIATVPGSTLECEIAGEQIETVSFRIKGPMGRAQVQVDELPPTVLEGWFSETWGFFPVDIVARNLKPGPHRVRVQLLEEKNAASTGHEFRLFGIAAVGVAPK